MPASNAACRYHSRLGRSGAGFSRMSSWAHDHSRKLGVNLRACDLMPNWGHSRFENGSGTPFLEGDSPRKLVYSQALSEPRPRAKNAIGLAIPTAKVSEK